MNNGNRPANPLPIVTIDGTVYDVGEYSAGKSAGLTKREVFAMAAMQGLMGNEDTTRQINIMAICEAAVNSADALLKALENKQ